MLDTGAYLSALAADSEAFADLIDDPHSTVPTCPGWTVAELVIHLGQVYSWVCLALAAGGERPAGPLSSPPSDESSLAEWFKERRAEVIDQLSARQPDQPAWNFARRPDTQTVGWWRRRQAMETSIHLHDLQVVAGQVAPIAPDLAADGIDELLSVFLPNVGRKDPTPLEALAGTLHLHCNDADGEWTVDFSSAPPLVTREHAKADTAVRGPASDLFLWVWNRRSLEGLEVFGDRGRAEAFAEVKL